jgi:hypothetical protein
VAARCRQQGTLESQQRASSLAHLTTFTRMRQIPLEMATAGLWHRTEQMLQVVPLRLSHHVVEPVALLMCQWRLLMEATTLLEVGSHPRHPDAAAASVGAVLPVDATRSLAT